MEASQEYRADPLPTKAIDPRFLRRARCVKVIMVGLTLNLLSVAGFFACSRLRSADWHTPMSEAPLVLFLATIFTPLAGIIYFVCYSLLSTRGRPKLRQQAWLLSILAPTFVALSLLVVPALLDRVFPGRPFLRFTGNELPDSSTEVRYTYDGGILETHFVINFRASKVEIQRLVRDFGAQSSNDKGIEVFDAIPVRGDWGELTVNWDTGEVRLEYLDV